MSENFSRITNASQAQLQIITRKNLIKAKIKNSNPKLRKPLVRLRNRCMLCLGETNRYQVDSLLTAVVYLDPPPGFMFKGNIGCDKNSYSFGISVALSYFVLTGYIRTLKVLIIRRFVKQLPTNEDNIQEGTENLGKLSRDQLSAKIVQQFYSLEK